MSDKLALLSKKPSRVMGVDLSTHSFAFSIWVDGNLIKWGEILFTNDSFWQRLNKAQKILAKIAREFNVQKILFESAVYIQNKKTVIQLAYAYGSLISPLAKKGIEVDEVIPTAWQNAIGNKALTRDEKATIQKMSPGKSKSWYTNHYREFRKERTKEWVALNTGVMVESDNVSDAIAIGWYGSR